MAAEHNGFRLHRPGTGDGRPVRAEPAAEAAPQPLDADALLDLSTDIAGNDVEETLRRLDAELVGLANVKGRVREIAALLLIDRARQRFGLSSSRPTMHMSFTGGPGTGKTTVALRMAEMLHALGYIRKPKVHTVTRDDLVGQFIGHTAPKTKEALAKAAGGVLFIDEAYYLFRPENERDYGQEVIEILLQEMESERDSLVVIFAGYPDRMERFFSANPGLSSRVAHHLEFADYTHAELLGIAELMVARENFRFDPAAHTAFAEYLTLRMARPRFSNARSVRNALDRCRLRQAKRLVELHRPLGKSDLITLTDRDVYGSSVFEHDRSTTAPPDGPSARAPV
ncbi:putative ATPase [Nocardia brasiliensis NBRC 14402]|uniref:AAA family ATPase n=1 Tax=Nocardia brasiliensis TaxID=37326 RepID=UPI0002F362E1|nr:AAA family ATPase [Nocardia brasiliensis]ASF07492.1 CbbX protein [Nocardia brasiliensis]GAJ79592.1 putative ATPase [Nocardia brasiliensis NBRC 14402]SUB55565.1 CbbX protein [Nocardia brasiliensis]